MARRRGSISVALILLALALVGVAAVVVVWGPMAGALGINRPAQQRTATATVVTSTPCGPASSGDVVEVDINGASRQARLDGCGHTQGQRLQVQIPANASDQDLVVRPYTPDMSDSSTGDSLPARLNWVLLSLAAIAGGGYMLMLRSRPT